VPAVFVLHGIIVKNREFENLQFLKDGAFIITKKDEE
jgi:hypothetical protein